MNLERFQLQALRIALILASLWGMLSTADLSRMEKIVRVQIQQEETLTQSLQDVVKRNKLLEEQNAKNEKACLTFKGDYYN